jgi:arylsulfatase A-like enzyme
MNGKLPRTQRWLLIGFVLVLCSSLVVVRPGAVPAGAAQNRPNIVLVLIDDQDEVVSPYWESLPTTARLVRDQGLRFANNFVATPICCPGRASLLTGKYGHNTGVLTNGGEQGGWETFHNRGNEERTFAKYLQDAGYRTVLFGKYMNGYEVKDESAPPLPIPAGWSEFYSDIDDRLQAYLGYGYTLYESRDGKTGTPVEYGFSEKDYFTDVVARKSVDFIQRAEANDAQPFFMYVAPTAPHLPIPPARRHEQISEQWIGALPQDPNYDEPDISDKPLWLRVSGDRRSSRMGWNEIDFPNRMGSLYAVDEMVEQIVRTLAENNELDNTILIFTSDNGYNLGAHRLLHKMAPYEESLHVPLAIAGPGIRNGVEQRLTMNIDLAPTVLELVGLPIPADMDGRSLTPLLRGEPPANWRADFFAQYISGGGANGIGSEVPTAYWYLVRASDIPGYRALRTENNILIEWYEDAEYNDRHEFELYDLRADRYQLQNLLSTPQGQAQYAALVEQLKARMEQLSACAGQSCRE